MARHAHFAVLSRKLNSSGRDISEVRRGPPRRYISIRLRGSKICRRRFLNSPAELTSLSLYREMYRRCSSGEEKKARRRFTSARRIYEPSAGGIPRLTSPISPKKSEFSWEEIACSVLSVSFYNIQCICVARIPLFLPRLPLTKAPHLFSAFRYALF